MGWRNKRRLPYLPICFGMSCYSFSFGDLNFLLYFGGFCSYFCSVGLCLPIVIPGIRNGSFLDHDVWLLVKRNVCMIGNLLEHNRGSEMWGLIIDEGVKGSFDVRWSAKVPNLVWQHHGFPIQPQPALRSFLNKKETRLKDTR